MAAADGELPVVYFAVSNIPSAFRSADLRNYFSQFIESGGFRCFHYRHRPEVLRGAEEGRRVPAATSGESAPPDPRSSGGGTGEEEASGPPETTGEEEASGPPETTGEEEEASGPPETTGEEDTSGPPETTGEEGDDAPKVSRNKSVQAASCCCVVSVFRPHADRFVKMYGGNQWIDSKGSWLARLCVIRRVKVSHDTDVDPFPYKTKHEQRHRVSLSDRFTQADLNGLPELNPPALMQNGNVGTSVKVFLQLIQSCRLPPRLIRKLGLTFPKTSSNRRYGNVPFQYYNTFTVEASEENIFTAAGHEIAGPSGVANNRPKLRQLHGQTEFKETENLQDDEEEGEEDEQSNADDDDDRCEDWERHEALHEDVTSQERSKERLFEEEIELKWEKGGSGLVFYTDAQYWQEEEGDFDEQTADDWDVDMSVYYDKDGGDMDSRDYVRMRYEKRLRDGLEDRSGHTQPIGSFERFTKGFGRRVMEKQGWKDGEGLGDSRPGIPDALESDGQHPNCKRGFGYHGEKLNFNPGKKPRADYHISTVYDQPKDVDKCEPLLRRHPNINMKYREWQRGGTIGPRR